MASSAQLATTPGTTIARMASADQELLTIDELARRTDMTVRNVRAYQSRGLLPAPEVRARTGYYGPEHVARLRLIREMQAEGYNLKAIERLLQAANGVGEQILDYERAVLTSFVVEEPEFATVEELEERLDGPFDEKTMKKAEKLGLIRPLGKGRFEVPSPTLLRAGEELVSLGIPLSHALAVGEKIRRHTEAIAEAFVRLYVRDVVGGVEPGDRSAQEWERLRSALERLRPLAAEAINAGFHQAMSRVVEKELSKDLRR